MNAFPSFALTCITIIVSGAGFTQDSDDPHARRVAKLNNAPDVSKTIIELPLEAVIASQPRNELATSPTAPGGVPAIRPAPGKLNLDVSKRRIEFPTEQMIAAPQPAPVNRVTADAAKTTDEPPETSSSESIGPVPSENPSVAPGRVNWHDDFSAACRASRMSGKPVLLFHLLGNLDQRFT